MRQNYIVIDVALCHDCNNCFMACKDEHVGNDWPPYTGAQPRHGHRWIDILRRERGQYPRVDVAYLPMPCQHCEDAPCVRAHPDCIVRHGDGTVRIDPVKARGKPELTGSCPYGAIYWNAESNAAQKCTMCAHILDGGAWEDGNMPRCVHSCPTGAMEFYRLEPDEMAKKIAGEGLERYRPELSPGGGNVLYRNLGRFTKLFVAGGVLSGGECAEGVEVTLSGDGCPGALQKTDYFGDFKFDNLEPGTYTLSINGEAVRTVTADASVDLGSIVIG